MSSEIISHKEVHPQGSAGPALHEAFHVMAYGLTETSKRQYRHSFEAWGSWCADTKIAPYDLSAAHVIGFLDSTPLSPPYQNGAVDPPAPTGANAAYQRRVNAGLRRSEAVALKWSDMDFEAGLLTVRHGKGNKERTIGFASDKALEYLRRWRAEIPGYEYVFVAVNKGDNVQADAPISTETVRRVTIASGDFKPHDARRTLITRMLLSGTALPDAQYTAGHANGATTMGYAVIKDAKEVKGRIKIDY